MKLKVAKVNAVKLLSESINSAMSTLVLYFVSIVLVQTVAD